MRVSVADLSSNPHPVLAGLRSEEPVAWVDSLDAWLVTGHDPCVRVMLDPTTFTVDDPGFSTQQVIGPSMLSLDGLEHKRHRDPFSGPFRAAQIRELAEFTRQTADALVTALASRGSGELRSGVAGPLAVAVMARVLDLRNVEIDGVLGWYTRIVDAVHTVTAGGEVPRSGVRAFDDLKTAVVSSLGSSSLLEAVEEEGSLTVDEIVSNVAVLLFGGIVTSESSIAIAYRYLLGDPALMTRLGEDHTLVRPFVDETFRLEPSAAGVDRYATCDVTLGEAEIAQGDLVRVSLSGANRDPVVFDEPDLLDLGRDQAKTLTFARGPHACLGIHLARLETVAAVESLLGHPPEESGHLDPVTGLVFRAPETVVAFWPETDSTGR